jgi:hypothetical protein
MADTSGFQIVGVADGRADAGVMPASGVSKSGPGGCGPGGSGLGGSGLGTSELGRWIPQYAGDRATPIVESRTVTRDPDNHLVGASGAIAVEPLALPPIADWAETRSPGHSTDGASGPSSNGSNNANSSARSNGSARTNGSANGLRTRSLDNERAVQTPDSSGSESPPRTERPGDGRSRAKRAASNSSATPRSRVVRSGAAAKVVPQSCQWCRQPLGPRNHSGRRRVYCSQSCRQRAYQSRKRSKQLGLKEGELLVSSVLLARMNRRLQALEAALREVELSDLQSTDERIAKLCNAARRLRRMVVGPPTR